MKKYLSLLSVIFVITTAYSQIPSHIRDEYFEMMNEYLETMADSLHLPLVSIYE
jgi:hypothetical protein